MNLLYLKVTVAIQHDNGTVGQFSFCRRTLEVKAIADFSLRMIDSVGFAGLAGENNSAAGWLQASAICFVLGIFIFSGSLYTMAFTGITRLGMITPIGGVFLIVAWLLLATGAGKLVIEAT